jgi:hypothetical protein
MLEQITQQVTGVPSSSASAAALLEDSPASPPLFSADHGTSLFGGLLDGGGLLGEGMDTKV